MICPKLRRGVVRRRSAAPSADAAENGEIVRVEREAGGREAVLDARDSARAWDRQHVRAEREQPRDGYRMWRRAVLRRDARELGVRREALVAPVPTDGRVRDIGDAELAAASE